jgi:hypothetical protein
MTVLEDALFAHLLCLKSDIDRAIELTGLDCPRWPVPADLTSLVRDDNRELFFLFRIGDADVHQMIDGSFSTAVFIREDGSCEYHSTLFEDEYEAMKKKYPSALWVYYESMRPSRYARINVVRGG